MRIVCWQTILMKYHTLLFQKLGKMSQNLSSAAVVIGALRVKNILRDFKSAPFYILCLFHMIDLRMFYLSFFILLQNGL